MSEGATMGGIEVELLSAACNRSPGVVSWGLETGLLAYGASNSVFLRFPSDATDNGAHGALSGHAARVNAVLVIEARATVSVISGSADKTVRIWTTSRDVEKTSIWTPGETLTHESSISALAAAEADDAGELLLAVATSECHVTLWTIKAGKGTLKQTLHTPKVNMISLAVAYCPSLGLPLLVAGGVDSKLHLYAPSSVDGSFASLCAPIATHIDWIGALSFAARPFAHLNRDALVLASASHDRSVRIWVIEPLAAAAKDAARNDDDVIIDPSVALLAKIAELTSQHETARFTLGPSARSYSMRLEALLVAHDDMVRSVQWAPAPPSGAQPLQLLTSSADKTIMLWEPEDAEAGGTGVWVNKTVLGDVGGQNNFGFVGAIYGPRGESILAYGHNGAFHLWAFEEDRWQPHVIPGGHFGSVTDAQFDPSGSYLVTVSADQTTRIWGQWARSSSAPRRQWCELGRAQVHGYDLACIAFAGHHEFITGADEKVLRVFGIPQSSLQSFSGILGYELPLPTRPIDAQTAHTPALGLSNKAAVHGTSKARGGGGGDEDDGADGDEPSLAVQSIVLTQPPFESALAESTLWAEVEKLYGHGYELFSAASDHSGCVLASACKASQPEFAAIWLWDTATWKPTGRIAAHSLTTTQMAFSPDNEWLLSVSRDRSFALSRRTAASSAASAASPTAPYTLSHVQPKAHARVLWSCAWTPDSAHFATCARDGEVRLWSPATPTAATWAFKLASAATAVAFASCRFLVDAPPSDAAYLLAVGAEVGRDSRLLRVTSSTHHVLSSERGEETWWPASACVNRLVFRSVRGAAPRTIGKEDQVEGMQLAVAADDGAVRIVHIVSDVVWR